jgi:UDP-N-acetylmuramoyl-L-alanyl-D-glutamate--2,6-diaminopimelate ligase
VSGSLDCPGALSVPQDAADAGASGKVLGVLLRRLEDAGQLDSLIPAVGSGAADPASLEITAIVYDSRKARAGSLFVAIPGEHADGHDFLLAVARAGAAAAIVERPVSDLALAQIVVPDSRLALAIASAWWFGDPSLRLGIVGVTGTDGKTTTAFLANAVLEAAGISTGLITTAAAKVGRELVANAEHVTTPQAPELQDKLRQMVAAGNEAAVVESTSHGLALRRVAEIAYDVAILTNLTHEHLELHGTFEAYRDAKLSLFSRLGRGPLGGVAKRLPRPWPRTAIVNVEDPSAPLFIEAGRAAGARVVTYGIGAAASADVVASDVRQDAGGLVLSVTTPRWHGPVKLRLAGRFNVSNALAAIALGEALELDPEAVRSGLEGVDGVPGRMERVDRGQPFAVVVDYAHSPAALEKVLDMLAPVAAPRAGLIAVFGSAGERDVQKRPLMGRIAGERCRLVIVTDEDPRGEDSRAILDEIAAGAEDAGKRRGIDLLCIADRAEAIAEAFSRAAPGDVVLLAGKGHEQSIITATGAIPWNERAEAIRALQRLGFASDGQGPQPQAGEGH